MLRTTPHTRLPLCEDNLDNIIGMLHMKKVAHALVHGEMTRETLLRAGARARSVLRAGWHDARHAAAEFPARPAAYRAGGR